MAAVADHVASDQIDRRRIGGLLGVLSVLLVAWMVAVPLASSPYPSLVRAVDQSTIVREIDGVMPNSVRNVYSSFGNSSIAVDSRQYLATSIQPASSMSRRPTPP